MAWHTNRFCGEKTILSHETPNKNNLVTTHKQIQELCLMSVLCVALCPALCEQLQRRTYFAVKKPHLKKFSTLYNNRGVSRAGLQSRLGKVVHQIVQAYLDWCKKDGWSTCCTFCRPWMLIRGWDIVPSRDRLSTQKPCVNSAMRWCWMVVHGTPWFWQARIERGIWILERDLWRRLSLRETLASTWTYIWHF